MFRSYAATLLLALFALNVDASTFQVTLTTDPSPDGCLPGDCSLREAMEAAAANDPLGETDVILVPAGTIALNSARGPLPDVVQPLLVQGAGSAQTFISMGGAMRVFSARDGGDLALVGLNLDSPWNGGLGQSQSVLGHEGSRMVLDDVVVKEGWVFVHAGSSVEIRHSRLLDVLKCENCSGLLVEDSTIANIGLNEGTPNAILRRVVLDNSLDHNPHLNEIYAVAHVLAGALTIEDSTITRSSLWISNPSASIVLRRVQYRDGGDAGYAHVRSGTLRIEDSTITRRRIYLDSASANLHLRRVRYLNSAAPIQTEAAATVTIEDSLFEGNLVRALYAAGGAEWTITGSSFVDNRVDGNAGGAILLEDDTTLRIRNSTFSGNTFTVEAAAAGARGGAIGFRNGSGAQLILTHVTFAAPGLMPVGVVGSAIGGHGGGVALTLSNSIVRGTCGLHASVLGNNTGNIESGGDTCGLDPEQNRVNVSAASLALGPLGEHGGPTPTYLPGTGSLAIDRASTPQCLPADQRGHSRPGGLRCDVGAVEADGVLDVLFANGFE